MRIQSLKELVHALRLYEKVRPNLEDFTSTLFGMTASDLQNPARYWRQLAESYKDRVSYCDVKRRYHSISPDLQVQSWQRPDFHVFHPYPLVQEVSVKLLSDSSSTPLPHINWRVHHEDDQPVVTLSQVQTPALTNTSVEQARNDEITNRGRLRNLAQFAKLHPREWKYLFPDLPTLPLNVHKADEWQSIVAAIALGTQQEALIGRGEQTVIDHLVSDLSLSLTRAQTIFQQYLTVVRSCRAMEGRLTEPREVREARSKQNRLFTKLDQALPEEWNNGALVLSQSFSLEHFFPTGKYVSLLLFISWLNKRHLHDLRIPGILPYQSHQHQASGKLGELDYRIISHVIVICEQLISNVDGIEWRVPPTQDDYGVLSIADSLSSRYGWINDLLKG